VGDLVYYDGTYGDAAKDNDEKTVIGLCCYVAPRKADGSINEKFHNPLDKHTRLMSSLTEIKLSNRANNEYRLPWGCADSSGYVNESIYSTNENGVKQPLSINGVEVYDIKRIPNIGIYKYTNPSGNTTSSLRDEDFRDEISDDGILNGGFTPIPADITLGDGFAYQEPQEYQDVRKIDSETVRLAGEGYSVGDMVNSGYAKTLHIIAHRNNIINHCYRGNTINGISIPLAPVSASDGDSELDILTQRIIDIRNWAKGTGAGQLGDTQYGDKWSQLYYPAVSACYAYEPKSLKIGEVLSNKFREHNWFMPTQGLLARLYWYNYKVTGGISADNLNSSFNDAINKGLYSKPILEVHWSITEGASYNAWNILFREGMTYGTLFKGKNYSTIAVCAF
jgi:hypothetical protein